MSNVSPARRSPVRRSNSVEAPKRRPPSSGTSTPPPPPPSSTERKKKILPSPSEREVVVSPQRKGVQMISMGAQADSDDDRHTISSTEGILEFQESFDRQPLGKKSVSFSNGGSSATASTSSAPGHRPPLPRPTTSTGSREPSPSRPPVTTSSSTRPQSASPSSSSFRQPPPPSSSPAIQTLLDQNARLATENDKLYAENRRLRKDYAELQDHQEYANKRFVAVSREQRLTQHALKSHKARLKERLGDLRSVFQELKVDVKEGYMAVDPMLSELKGALTTMKVEGIRGSAAANANAEERRKAENASRRAEEAQDQKRQSEVTQLEEQLAIRTAERDTLQRRIAALQADYDEHLNQLKKNFKEKEKTLESQLAMATNMGVAGLAHHSNFSENSQQHQQQDGEEFHPARPAPSFKEAKNDFGSAYPASSRPSSMNASAADHRGGGYTTSESEAAVDHRRRQSRRDQQKWPAALQEQAGLSPDDANSIWADRVLAMRNHELRSHHRHTMLVASSPPRASRSPQPRQQQEEDDASSAHRPRSTSRQRSTSREGVLLPQCAMPTALSRQRDEEGRERRLKAAATSRRNGSAPRMYRVMPERSASQRNDNHQHERRPSTSSYAASLASNRASTGGSTHRP